MWGAFTASHGQNEHVAKPWSWYTTTFSGKVYTILTGQSPSGQLSGMQTVNLNTPSWYKPCRMKITPNHTAIDNN